MKSVFMFFDSPVGRLRLVATDGQLTAIYLPNHKRAPESVGEEHRGEPVLLETARQLTEYFAGTRTCFELPLGARGSEFQRTVWEALRGIPFGTTRTYGELARVVGNERASRAVGAANGRNPLSIVVPCHRVIGSNGSLTGYAGGEAAKQWLLQHEERVLREPGPRV